MEEKIRQAFINATPNHADSLAAKMLLSPTKTRKGAEKPMKPVKTSIQFRAIATLAATVAVVVLIASLVLIRDPGAGPAAQPSDTAQNAPSLNSKDPVALAQEYVREHAPELLKDADWDWKYIQVGSNVAQQFELDGKPYDFIINIYSDGVIDSYYEDEVVVGNSGITPIGIEAALKAAREYNYQLSVPLNLPDMSPDTVDWELDDENGSYYYEIDVNCSAYEVEFLVRADTGQVLTHEVDEAEDFSDAQSPSVDTQGPTDNTEGPPINNPLADMIAEKQAIEIALKYFDLSKGSTEIRIEEEFDGAVPHYDVELKSNGYEYNIEIRRSDGQILEVDKELDDDNAEITPPDGNIGTDLAIQTALDYVGLSMEDVWDIECEPDTDDAVKHYEVSFKYLDVEYDIEVGMYEPTVLKAEKELID